MILSVSTIFCFETCVKSQIDSSREKEGLIPLKNNINEYDSCGGMSSIPLLNSSIPFIIICTDNCDLLLINNISLLFVYKYSTNGWNV